MSMIQLDEYPNLVVDKKVLKSFKNLTKEQLSTITQALLFFDAHGADKDILGKKLDTLKGNYKKIKEFKVKVEPTSEWRFLFIKISKGKKPAKYAILHGFFKTTPTIRQQDKEYALKVAKREGY